MLTTSAQGPRAGVADRIRTVQADLDQPWPDLGRRRPGLGSASLHHMADPDRPSPQVLAALRPGGLFVVTELDSFPRFLPATGPARPWRSAATPPWPSVAPRRAAHGRGLGRPR